MITSLLNIHPYLTSHIPGCGGEIKCCPEDFIVEEIPAYLPCGSGDHCYLYVEKRGISTLEAIRRIARYLNIQERDVGYAGMKDAVGITRQTFSVEHISPEKALGMKAEGLTILSANRHTNKLKLGHLKGNSFSIVVRNVTADALKSVTETLAVMERRGVPNYFGYQRYGVQGNSHLIGAAMLRHDWQTAIDHLIGQPELVRDESWQAAIFAYRQGNLLEALQLMPRQCRDEREVLQRLASRPGAAEKAFAAIHPRLKKLYLSAFQSSLFDQVVAQRIQKIDAVMDGDLAWKHANGACFQVENSMEESPRAQAFEISASGPLFGCKMKQPAGLPLAIEREIIENTGLQPDSFDLPGGLRMEGERRPLRVPLSDAVSRWEENCLRLEFSLPKGSYATSVLREIMK